jgi:superfamily II DNA/RNA helicase
MNPIRLANEIEERYRRYLKTTFYFKDPVLRSSFEDALGSGPLSKGPYLEATPVFKRGSPPNRLFRELLRAEPEQGFLTALQGERPLYRHQEQAIRSIFDGRNAIVATGTGSGKTEAFLYPILLHLYQEFQAGALGPCVRALVLYPMNALANDQRERLGEICKRLREANSSFRFTFGQYIGETPENENDSQRHARDHLAQRERQGYSVSEKGRVVHGELVLRSEMRTTPPHILLTNYSMLEYLLLRPDDSPLFDDGRAQWWTFLVLDEAHQYRGARGIEMAMLLRRLKQRLREGGRTGPFRCLATSATLVGGEGDRSAVARFAFDLFGEQFEDRDVILGEAEPIPDCGIECLDREDYQAVSRILERAEPVQGLSAVATKLGLPIPEAADGAKAIGSLLQADSRAARLRRLVIDTPTEVQAIADQVFPDLPRPERIGALSDLVSLLLRAKDPASGTPLLSARYHLFLRSLEGAFLSYWPDKKVLLDRRAAGEGALFEVGLCRECGQHYLVGKVTDNKLLEAVRDPGRADFGAAFFLPVDDRCGADEDTDNDGAETYRLCARCGEIRRFPEGLQCHHDASILVQKQTGAEEREDQIPRCAVCGYQAPDPVREVVHGTDGPHAVIATTLYQSLPQTRRKVLAFADGRQEAAFFAWYLEDSYKDILHRNLLLKVAQEQDSDSSEGSSLEDLATGLRDFYRRRSVFPAATSDLQLRREAWLGLYREFLTDEPRISLEGVGLARWSLRWPDWFRVPESLTHVPWSLSEQETRDVIFVLLDSMRADRAVELHGDTTIALNWNDLRLQAAQMRFRIGAPKGQKGVRSWDGVSGKRVRFIAKLLTRIQPNLAELEAPNIAVNTARAVWDALRECDEHAPTSNDRLLLSVHDARRLNPDWWRLRFIHESDSVFRCDTCGRIQSVSVRGVCARHRCPGSLQEIHRQNLEPNHYRLLYEAELPGSLRVEEHTAQLDKEKAREFQRDFREGRIHVLSCSTTFELGVDLGDLDTIFLRNVPPEAFNYAQRVGRAGRRSGYPGFAITYCRRGPHDLYHFSEPHRMLSGRVQPPVLALRNKKIITRHIVAVALSFFFRAFRHRFQKVETLFENLNSPTGVAEFKRFLLHNRPRVEETIRSILPTPMAAQWGLSDASWIDEVTGEGSRFALAEDEVASDFQTVMRLEESARNKRDYRTAEWAQRRADTIANEEILSFLSRKAVIPKYGFPVDVVELDPQRTQYGQEAFEVSLQRDLSIAISEFAPTSKLVANKKEWTSYGLKKVAEREWPSRLYGLCRAHNVFLRWEKGEPEPTLPCGDRLRAHTYVIPQFGFVTDRDKPRDPNARPAKVFSTRPYFVSALGPEPGLVQMPATSPVVAMKKASPGLMVVLCEGRRGAGFYLCGGCGAGFRTRQSTHKTPQGQDCHGTLEQVSLGHEFVTDVLQLQFRPVPHNGMDMVWFAFSLAYAMVEGAAEVLEVPSVDLSATVAHGNQQSVPPIVIYDNVPGGAGLVARLEGEEVFVACLQAALKRVEGGCGCAPNTSCYGCLRSYRNQFGHQFLQRGPVQQYISSVLPSWCSLSA